MYFIFVTLLVASLQLSAAIPLADPCTCPRQYQPVCGSNGETYNNRCLLDCVASTSYVTLAKLGPCDQINTGICSCSLEYIPVCGNDGKTYPNTCHLSCKYRDNPSLDVAYEGECNSNINHPNVCVCDNNYKPVCGTDGVTYGNDCLLNCATAKNSGLGIAYYTSCTNNVGAVRVARPNFE